MKNELKASLLEALKGVSQGKNLDPEIVESALREALVSAARKYLQLNKRMEVEFEDETNEVKVFLRCQVVEDFPDYDEEMSAEEVALLDEGYMLLEEARDFNEDAQVGDFLEMEIPVIEFGRQAIQTAKQFLIQKVRDAERIKVFNTYKSRVGTLVSGKIQQIDRGNAIINLGSTEGILPARERIRGERVRQGDSVQAYIANVSEGGKGPQVLLSRAHNGFLAELFKLEVPEIYDGTVEIKGIARDPGLRAKIAVHTRDDRVDPVGACVGMKGNRVQSIVRELNNERIDIVQWSEDFGLYVRRALSPAAIVRISEVEGTRRVVVVVEEADLAQAIGRSGQNVRLASQLVDRDLDVYGEEEYKAMSDEDRAMVLSPRENDRPLQTVADSPNSLDDLFKTQEEE